MTRRIAALVRRDLVSAVRDYILIYGLLAPFLLALILRAFLPSVGGMSVNLVVTPEVDQEIGGRLTAYGHVQVVADRQALEKRVLALDDAAGIVKEGETYRVVLEGNEAEATAMLPGLILGDITATSDGPGVSPAPGNSQAPAAVTITEADLGRVASPFKPLVAVFLAVISMLIGGMLIGFAIIEDKETGTLAALAVSPLSRAEYVAGRSAVGLALSLVLVFGSLWLFGAGPFNGWQVLVMSLGGAFLAVIYGLYTGSVSANQIAGIATVKTGSLVFLVPPLAASLLPAKWQLLLYWLPTYWTYRGYNLVLSAGGAGGVGGGAGGAGAPWGEVLRLAGISLAVNVLFLAASWRLLRRKLALRG